LLGKILRLLQNKTYWQQNIALGADE
jgi:hypothetical protein